MSDFLTVVSTTTKKKDSRGISEIKPASKPKKGPLPRVDSSQDVLEILKNEPSFEILRKVLKYLASEDYSIKVPGSTSAQIINVLVKTTLPDYWAILKEPESKTERAQILECLSSVSGVGAFMAHLKALVNESHQKRSVAQGRDYLEGRIHDLLEGLESILAGDTFFQRIKKDIQRPQVNDSQRSLLWREIVSLTASSKALTVAAQVEEVLSMSDKSHKPGWLSDGDAFAKWLGANIAKMSTTTNDDDQASWDAIAQLLDKSFGLGKNDILVHTIHHSLSLASPDMMSKFTLLIQHLASYRVKPFLVASINALTKEFLEPRHPLSPSEAKDAALNTSIGGVASFVSGLMQQKEDLKSHMVDMILDNSTFSIYNLATKRAIIAALSSDEDCMETLLEKSLGTFSDALYIKHSPMLQQESLAATILLSSGYVHRTQPTMFLLLARSSQHMQGVSNRLAATSPRSRFLGMVVGMAISELVDAPDKRVKFEFPESELGDSKHYLSLIHVEDRVGRLEDLIQKEPARTSKQQPQKKAVAKPKPKPAPAPKAPPKAIQVIELSSDSEDDDLVPYAKPDSDSGDDEDDPTLVRRDKPRAPVYIRDLIEGLRETKDYDKHLISLENAAELIRRKSNFGREIHDHIEELANALVGYTDPFDIDNSLEMRQKALNATLLVDPVRMGKWLASTFFEGDYSISQRLSILTALGLGARELAGFKDDIESSSVEKGTSQAFPSKMLPDHLHKIYSDDGSAIDSVTRKMEHLMIQPMAEKAQQELSGPKALQVRTFSTRMEVEKRRKRPIANELAKVVADSFFFPLTGRFVVHTQALRGNSFALSSHVLPIFLKTLAFIFQASGPSTLSLPQMTSEFWSLLLNLRGQALNDVNVMEALLFALLVLIETNTDQRRLAREHGSDLFETQEWAKMVHEQAQSSNAEGERVTVLSAGVVVRAQEVVDKFRKDMLGDLVDV